MISRLPNLIDWVAWFLHSFHLHPPYTDRFIIQYNFRALCACQVLKLISSLFWGGDLTSFQWPRDVTTETHFIRCCQTVNRASGPISSKRDDEYNASPRLHCASPHLQVLWFGGTVYCIRHRKATKMLRNQHFASYKQGVPEGATASPRKRKLVCGQESCYLAGPGSVQCGKLSFGGLLQIERDWSFYASLATFRRAGTASKPQLLSRAEPGSNCVSCNPFVHSLVRQR